MEYYGNLLHTLFRFKRKQEERNTVQSMFESESNTAMNAQY